MSLHHPVFKPVTPLSPLDICYWKAEDSGYHTTYTPGSLECSEISIEAQAVFKPEVNLEQTRNYSQAVNESWACYEESASQQRAVKRLFRESNVDIDYSFVPTPTREIAGGLKGLHFNDDRPLNCNYRCLNTDTPDCRQSSIYYNANPIYSEFPSTPLKKRCRSSCKISSPLNSKKLPKALDFAIHSVSCEKKALQPINPEKKYTSKPNKKLDILKMLYRDGNSMPPIKKIFSYLTHKDMYNVAKVSPTWNKICQDVWCDKSKRQGYLNFLNNIIANLENSNNIKSLSCSQEINTSTPRSHGISQLKPLGNIQNVHHNNLPIITQTSPTRSPRTTRFKRFIKSAASDSRTQLRCVKCQQPAKVTTENTGEEWVECISMTCSYQFCRVCKYDRHTGKPCVQFDLDGPSPSKRKKGTNAICTKKSRRNLRRLL